MSDFIKVLLVGSSGKGKTFTSKTLNQNTTGFINAENKPLLFGTKFKYHSRPSNFEEAYKAIIEYVKNPEIYLVFIDSFSAILEYSLTEARKTKKGYDVWNHYNECISKLLELIKRAPKTMFITAHYEVIENVDGNNEKMVKTKGKEWRGQIEREFSVVLFADSKFDDTTKKPIYWYNTFQEGTSAKCSSELISELTIPNDGKLIFDNIIKFQGNTTTKQKEKLA